MTAALSGCFPTDVNRREALSIAISGEISAPIIPALIFSILLRI
jgi:hypothetical protein